MLFFKYRQHRIWKRAFTTSKREIFFFPGFRPSFGVVFFLIARSVIDLSIGSDEIKPAQAVHQNLSLTIMFHEIDHPFTVFLLGVMVSCVIAKGLMQARDDAAEELARQEPPVEEKIVE
jgi:flagellar basal body-associated protein FliL